MNLIFRHKGRLRQGDEYIHYATGDVSRPLVYLSPDGSEVFLVSRAVTGAFSVRPLSQRQWMQIRTKYQITPVDPLRTCGTSVDALMGGAVAEHRDLDTVGDRIPKIGAGDGQETQRSTETCEAP